MKKFKILESIDSVVGADRFLVNMTCLGGDVVIKNKNQSVDDLFPGVDGGCRNDYFVALLRLLVIDEYVRFCGVVDFDFVGIDDDFFVNHDGIASGHFIDSVDGFREYSFNLVDVIGRIKNFDKNGSIGLMVGDLRFGCLEQFIIGCLGGGNNISANYWSKFKKFLVVNNLLLGVKGNYVGFNYERISDIFFGGVCDSFGIEFSLDEFFSYGLRDNVANSFNWKICFVDDSGKKKMVFKFNPYINIGTGEVYFDSFDKLRKDFVSGLISEGDFLVRNINYGGDCKDFVNGLRALQVDDFVIRSGFDSDLVNNSSIDNSSIDNSLLQEKLVRNNYRNRMCVKNYISYQRIADLLGYANKMGAWYMMQNQSMVILRNDRIEFAANAGVMDVVKTFGLGIHEVLSESDMAKKSKKKLKKNSKVLLLKEDKKDSNEEDLDGGLLVDFDSDLPILPKFGKTIEFVEEKLESFTKMQVSGMDLLNLQITETESIDNYLQVSLVKDNYVGKFAESFTDNKPVKKSINSDDFQQILNLCNDWVLEISELDVFKFENDEIHGADEKVIYYDRDEKLTEVEFLWLKDLFGDIVIGMSHPERNELFRCMMKNDKDIFGSFRIKRYLYDDLCENSLWKKAYELEIAERISNFKKSSQYFRWNLEFLNLGCLKSKEFIDIEMSKIVMDSLNKKYFGIDGNVIERKILRKKMVSEFGIFGLVNKLMNEISVIGIENFRKSRGLGNDFVENLKRDFVGDFNDLLQKMYLPCCVYKNKAGNLEVNYISEIRKIGNRNSVRNSSVGNSKEFPTSIVEYTQIVRNLTENVYKNNYELLNPNKLERSVIDSDFTCQLDHKYSIENGFVNGICPSVIASVENLEILPVLFNQIKGVKNSISLKELQRKIQEVA